MVLLGESIPLGGYSKGCPYFHETVENWATILDLDGLVQRTAIQSHFHHPVASATTDQNREGFRLDLLGR